MEPVRSPWKMIAIASVGTAIEYYEFIVYALFAKFIQELFFPKEANSALIAMAVAAIFAVGYLARPIGGLLFAHFGDRIGRKKTFTASILLMALPTLAIGLLPTYATLGSYAVIGLVLCRICQGLSMGGEAAGALVYVVETAPAGRRAFAGNLPLVGVGAGAIFGGFVSTMIVSNLSHDQILAWGWRLAFIFGGCVGLFSYHLRKKMFETGYFEAFKSKNTPKKFPLLHLLRTYPKQAVQGFGICIAYTANLSFLYFYIHSYLAAHFNIPIAIGMKINLGIVSSAVILQLIFAMISDRIGRKKVLVTGSLLALILSYFVFNVFATGHLPSIIGAIAVMVVYFTMNSSQLSSILVEIFPTEVRYTGIAFCLNVCSAIFSGLTPLIATTMIMTSSDPLSPRYYLMACAAITLIAACSLPETFKRNLQ